MLSQAGKIQTTNRRDRGSTAAEKHGLRQPFLLMKILGRGPAIRFEADDDGHRYPVETRNQRHQQEAFRRGIQRINSFYPRGREEWKTPTIGDRRL